MSFDYTIGQLSDAAQWVLEQAAQRRVIALLAPMGAGKTTLSGAILHQLGSSDHAASPTFSIINEYLLPGGEMLYHMDWYRLRDAEEARAAGVEEALYSGHRCLVEWPEKAPQLLPDDALRVTIEITGPETRRLQIAGEQ